MATKDPHIAYIDAHEQLEKIQAAVRATVELVKRKRAAGYQLTDQECLEIKMIQQKAIEATKRVQDAYVKEIESHGKLND